MARIELFAYPWDIVDRGPEAFADDCIALGVSLAHVTTLYHSGKFLLPRNRTRKVLTLLPGRLFMRLPEGALQGRLRPEVDSIAGSDWLERLAATRLPLGAWTVFHHGSLLTQQCPDLTIQNAYGDQYPFALCPSRPEVRSFSTQLAVALARTGYFESLDLETIGYLGYQHGHHHEVSAVPCGAATQFLLSLCFCDGCISVAQQAGIDAHCLRRAIREMLDTRFAADDACSIHPDDSGQIATLLAVTPGLSDFVRIRASIVSSLIREVRSAVSQTKLSVFTSTFVGAPSNIWMEGIMLPDVAQAVDCVHLLAYTSDSDRMNSDLVLTLSQVKDPARLCLTLNLGLPTTPSLGAVMETVIFAWKQGVRRFAFFNYGLLGPARLGWIGDIARELKKRERTQ